MKKNNVMLTAEGLVELKAELEELKNVKIPVQGNNFQENSSKGNFPP
jgi:hypothetical protein